MQLAHTHQSTLAYERAGDRGSPVLLIMGYCVPGKAWRFQVPALAERHQVAFFDNRGVGDSGHPALPWRMADMAGDALALMDHLQWPRAHIVGVSMGGMIAQELALARPDRVRSLSLIATHAGGLGAQLPTWPGLVRFAGTSVGSRASQLSRLKRLLFPPEFLESCDQAWLDDVMAHDFGRPIAPRTRRGQLVAVTLHDTAARLGRLAELDVLLIRPGRDLLVRPEQSDRLARLMPHARMVRLDEAGHGLIRQCAQQVNEALLGHFARADGRSAD